MFCLEWGFEETWSRFSHMSKTLLRIKMSLVGQMEMDMYMNLDVRIYNQYQYSWSLEPPRA